MKTRCRCEDETREHLEAEAQREIEHEHRERKYAMWLGLDVQYCTKCESNKPCDEMSGEDPDMCGECWSNEDE